MIIRYESRLTRKVLILSLDCMQATHHEEPCLDNFLTRKYLLELLDFLWSYYLDIAVLGSKRNSFYEDYFMYKILCENGICSSKFG